MSSIENALTCKMKGETNMKKKLSLLIAAILSLSLLTACGGDDPAPEGAYDNDDIAVSIVFYEDGTCVISDFDSTDEAEFKMDGDELTIEMDDMEVTGTYDADEDTFTLEDNDGEFYYVDEAWYTP